MAAVSVLIPAHNEAATLGRNLAALHHGLPPGVELDVVVVANGCTDNTVEVARSFHPHVRVVETPVPSKAAAVRAGNEVAVTFPRVHLDADVELDGASLDALIAPLADDLVLATAPRREIPRTGCSPLVRWYYDVWEQLPQVQAGLFGRGVVALSAEGQARVGALPSLMGDDLAASEAFTVSERRIVEDAIVLVHPPRTVADLLRRRVRAVTGNHQADQLGVRRAGTPTRVVDLVRLGVRRPRLLPRIPVFLALTLLSRLLARPALRSGDFTTWQRDESSREPT